MTLYARNNIWGLKRRVPVRYTAVEPRKVIWVSLKTDSITIARTKAEIVWQALLDAWEARLLGQDESAAKRYAAAMDLAQQRGFQFLPAHEVAQLPTADLVARLQAIMREPETAREIEAKAVLGGAKEVYPRLSEALESYWSLAAADVRRKSDDQRRRWENPRKKAIKNLIDVIGDKRLDKITPDDMQEFHDWWLDRFETDDISANSANKDITHIGVILKLVNDRKKFRLELPLSGYRFSEDEKTTRPAFSDGWIRSKLLAPDALNGLNPEARAILLGMINTGYRPSEGAALRAENIVLDNDVPMIRIAPEAKREIKTKSSKRYIPLTGISLDVFRAFPDGFARYQHSAASLSATLNKYLRENGLMESETHVVYSLRHSFEDRMLRAGFDERIRRDLMGHALDRERYGDGGGPMHKLKLLQEIAIG